MHFEEIPSGIYELMCDLGAGLNDPQTLMLGGGNPSILSATKELCTPILTKIINDDASFKNAFQSYSHPQGTDIVLDAIKKYFTKATHWSLEREHICITQGSQQGCYMLYNYLIGQFSGQFSKRKKSTLKPVLLVAKAPDYIGYFDLIPKDHFVSVNGKRNYLDNQTFIYTIDFAGLNQALSKDGKDYDVKAIIISTPNNPSAHALSQEDTDNLTRLAEQHDKLIIFDHAYGFPFPNIVFETPAKYRFSEHTLHCFSFSKIGLPGIRAGIMIGNPKLIEKMTILNGIVNLAPSSLNCLFLSEILSSPKFDPYIKNELFPTYRTRMEEAFTLFSKKLKGSLAELHKPQGGFFLWLRAPNFPLSSYALYEELKSQKAVVVPGNYFFTEVPEPDTAYLRISFTMTKKMVEEGLTVIADTIQKHYAQ